jgi:hypothetical protein
MVVLVVVAAPQIQLVGLELPVKVTMELPA